MKVAVLFGGDSMERDVSVASATQVVAALRTRGHDVAAVDMSRGLLSPDAERAVLTGRVERQPPERRVPQGLPLAVSAVDWHAFDLVFLALHGGVGENGTVQSVFDLVGVPYTGSGRLGSALAWDKSVAKQLLRAAGVPTPDWRTAPCDAAKIDAAFGFPVIVKPVGEGSTVGLSRVDGPKNLQAAIELAAGFDTDVMIERFVPGRELTVGILEGEPLAVGEIVPADGDIFDYAAKYQPGGAVEIFPADIPVAVADAVRAHGLAAHRALKLDDYSRVDFRMDPSGGLWCLEANTLPGLSGGSLLPQAAAAVGIAFPELCERICRAALARR